MPTFNFKITILLIFTLTFSSCATILRPFTPHMDPVVIDFDNVEHFGELSAYAYKSDTEIKNKYQEQIVAIRDLPKYDGKYFLIKDKVEQTIYISIRGTANLKNVIVDAEYVKDEDSKINIYLHNGFKKITDELYQDIIPFIEPYVTQGYKFSITGHSLGGAMAVILMMYLDADDYPVNKIITFGQPKVTNREGMKKYQATPLLRIIDDRDLVPLVPPLTFISAEKGPYRHFGPEVILLKEVYFSYLSHRQVEDPRATSFWDNIEDINIKDHHIASYLERIWPKKEEQLQVPYEDRKEYQ